MRPLCAATTQRLSPRLATAALIRRFSESVNPEAFSNPGTHFLCPRFFGSDITACNTVGAVATINTVPLTVPASQNELIDALECLASLAILSGMSVEQKIR